MQSLFFGSRLQIWLRQTSAWLMTTPDIERKWKAMGFTSYIVEDSLRMSATEYNVPM